MSVLKTNFALDNFKFKTDAAAHKVLSLYMSYGEKYTITKLIYINDDYLLAVFYNSNEKKGMLAYYIHRDKETEISNNFYAATYLSKLS